MACYSSSHYWSKFFCHALKEIKITAECLATPRILYQLRCGKFLNDALVFVATYRGFVCIMLLSGLFLLKDSALVEYFATLPWRNCPAQGEWPIALISSVVFFLKIVSQNNSLEKSPAAKDLGNIRGGKMPTICICPSRSRSNFSNSWHLQNTVSYFT